MKPGVYFHSLTDISYDVLEALGITHLTPYSRYLMINLPSHGAFKAYVVHGVHHDAIPMSLDQVKELALAKQLEM